MGTEEGSSRDYNLTLRYAERLLADSEHSFLRRHLKREQ